MATVEAAVATQLANIEKRTGQSLVELVKIARASGLSKHSEIRDHLKATLGTGFGDANALAHHAAKASDALVAKAATAPDSRRPYGKDQCLRGIRNLAQEVVRQLATQ